MKRVAFFMCLCLVISCNSQNELYEGSRCVINKTLQTFGVCKNFVDCPPAKENLRRGIYPTKCSFLGASPIVCCLNNDETTEADIVTKPQWTTSTAHTEPTTSTTLTLDTTTAEPDRFLSNPSLQSLSGPVTDVRKKAPTHLQETGDCPPISPLKTAAKTGQKAWDKCIEYQEQAVMPCDRSERRRLNDCRNDVNVWILNGEESYEGEFPHMALLGFGSDPENLSFLCGGSLISERYVLTAGHCITTKDIDPVSYVLLGVLKTSIFNQSNVYKVRSVYKHPDYKPPKKYNDIALLQLDRQVTLTGLIVPACLDLGDASDIEIATATGWGAIQFRGKNSDTLLKVDLTKFTEAECSKQYESSRNMVRGYDSNSQICYGDKSGSRDTCQGDSGGPLQVRHKKIYCMYTVIGITSFGRACGMIGQPGLYTKVSHYLPWIESLVWPDE